MIYEFILCIALMQGLPFSVVDRNETFWESKFLKEISDSMICVELTGYNLMLFIVIVIWEHMTENKVPFTLLLRTKQFLSVILCFFIYDASYNKELFSVSLCVYDLVNLWSHFLLKCFSSYFFFLFYLKEISIVSPLWLLLKDKATSRALPESF